MSFIETTRSPGDSNVNKLLLIAAMMILANLVNTTGEYILGRVVSRTAADAVSAGLTGGLSEGEWIGTFYSQFFSVVNAVALTADPRRSSCT